jgi:signal transduction histidine kinase
MSQRTLPPVKFLIVDDLDENLLALGALLRRDDLEILEARSGDQALELLLVHEVALALVDVQMPGMSGFELAELMRGAERTRHIPIIFVTAGAQEERRIFRGYDAGAVDLLFKPIDPHILRHKAETFFRLYRQRQQLAEQLQLLREAERERERLNQELVATLRLNETFVAAVGHDLRNPLNAILSCAEVLMATPGDTPARQVAERLRSSGRRMARMIDDLFDLARARLGGGIPIDCQPADLSAVASKAIAELEVSNPDRPIAQHFEGDLTGVWDAARLEQVLSNLLGNAIRHGAPAAPIRLDIVRRPADIVVSVHNDGVISPEVLPELFSPFTGTQDHRQRGDGLGLGLYIVRQIVLAHGGEVRVKSNEGDGTTFRVYLPIDAGKPALTPAPPNPRPS